MISIDKIKAFGFEAAIRGCRNPMNSWEKSDSYWDFPEYPDIFVIGNNDLKLMQSLVKSGTDHSKFMRMINVTMDITAPLYWWKEFDTYKVGTVANSCSTMHKIHSKEFTLDDFSHEHLVSVCRENLSDTINLLNEYRNMYIHYDEICSSLPPVNYIPSRKEVWWQMIQLLPSSYNQKRTVQLNYQVLRNIYFARRAHKLDEWHDFCHMIEELPYGKELVCLEDK